MGKGVEIVLIHLKFLGINKFTLCVLLKGLTKGLYTNVWDLMGQINKLTMKKTNISEHQGQQAIESDCDVIKVVVKRSNRVLTKTFQNIFISQTNAFKRLSKTVLGSGY